MAKKKLSKKLNDSINSNICNGILKFPVSDMNSVTAILLLAWPHCQAAILHVICQKYFRKAYHADCVHLKGICISFLHYIDSHFKITFSHNKTNNNGILISYFDAMKWLNSSFFLAR